MRVRQLIFSVAALLLAACSGNANVPGALPQGDGGTGPSSASRQGIETVVPAPTAPPDAPGHTNVVPTLPPKGHSRTGLVYNVYVQAATGDTVAFTVFEPHTVTSDGKVPLILQSHGWGGSRVTNLSTAESLGDVGNIQQFVANNYGVISLDERGWGESTGKIRSMDPDYEGKDDLAIM
ncbi:MAG: hypothetical protein IAI49_14555, partial [Candidatus Eremiobacteraeota bacterium]|nr:hypothetical protein [Candidatus Eremiobacteraeota bacterium]